VNGQLLIRADSFAQQVSKVVREAVSEPVAVTTESELEEKAQHFTMTDSAQVRATRSLAASGSYTRGDRSETWPFQSSK
jgi:hypothetical protein